MTSPKLIETSPLRLTLPAADSPYDVANYLIPSLGVDPPEDPHGNIFFKENVGYTAILRDDTWHVSLTSLSKEGRYITFRVAVRGFHALAYPIDPRMTREDIQDATIIEPNEDGTAWTFKHGNAGPHQEHLIAVRSGVVSSFQPFLDAALFKRFEATNNVVRNRATAKYQNLCQYRDDCLLYTSPSPRDS